MKKYISILIIALFVILGFSTSSYFSSYAGTWEKDDKGWRYNIKDDEFYKEYIKYIDKEYIKDGKYIRNRSHYIDYKRYFFDDNGYMITGWCNDEGSWYYIEEDGSLRTKPLIENGKTYYFEESTGWCLNPDGSDFTVDEIFNSWYYSYQYGRFSNTTDIPDNFFGMTADEVREYIKNIRDMVTEFESLDKNFEVKENRIPYAGYTNVMEEYKKMITHLEEYATLLESGRPDGLVEKCKMIEKDKEEIDKLKKLIRKFEIQTTA